MVVSGSYLLAARYVLTRLHFYLSYYYRKLFFFFSHYVQLILILSVCFLTCTFVFLQFLLFFPTLSYSVYSVIISLASSRILVPIFSIEFPSPRSLYLCIVYIPIPFPHFSMSTLQPYPWISHCINLSLFLSYFSLIAFFLPYFSRPPLFPLSFFSISSFVVYLHYFSAILNI